MNTELQKANRERIEEQALLVLREATDQNFKLDSDLEERIVSILEGADHMAQAELAKSSGLIRDIPDKEGSQSPEKIDDDVRGALATVRQAMRENPYSFIEVLRMIGRIPRSINFL